MTRLVLIVDDNRDNLYLLESLLTGHGFDVISAENGEEALVKARLNPPHLIVSDILMPVMDGYALCRACKLDDTLKQIPFVFYTATYTDEKDEKFSLALGADRFIIKPEVPDVLINVLSELLKAKKTSKPAVTKSTEEEMEFLRKHNEALFKKLDKKISDLEEANQVISLLEEKYRLYFEHVTDVVYTIDKDLKVLSMSPSVEKVMGYKPQDFIGKPVTDLGKILTPESLQQAIIDTDLILKGNTISATIYQFIARDGTIRYGEVSGSPIISNGQIIAIISVARDITDRKLTEDALRESEEKFRKILEDMEDVYFEVDITGMITFVNPSSCKKSGYTKEELLGMSFKQISVPDGIGQVMKYFGEIFQTGQTGKPFIWNLKKKNGEEGFFEVVASLIRDNQGNPRGFKGIGRDITERRKAEEALQRESNFSRAALDSLTALFYMYDDQGRFIRWNEYFTAVTGYSGEELARMTPLDVVVESERVSLKKTMEKVLSTKHVSAELSILCKDGSVKPHFLTGNLIEFENKQCVIGMGIDITERIKTETKLQQTLESLRKAVGTTIQVLVSAVEARDPYTAGHQSRVAHLACAIASEMGLAQDKIEGIRLAGSIHDIGKLSVPAEILTRPSKLTNIEFSMIKEHAQNGYEMLKHVESSWPLAEIVYQHHERINGSGYPRNLKGDEIIIEARIMAVADVVEAMASHRPYRPSLGLDAALEEIEKNRGILYEEAIAMACLKLFREKRYVLP
ncbi:MAG TPA: PAS domain S-box protein [Smithellaceae bacterium]|nr:PAS domain S-box protein [Smithellaceae bacterium]HPL66404.1 PAS domain S-box protein [Smithellaceae bacterium]